MVKVSSDTHTLLGIAENIRGFINKKLKTYHFKANELAIINALLLGQRQDISKETYTNYTNSGAIHILAVSGLHVGILLILLNFILKPLERFKHGKRVKTFLLVSLLWSFALIAGLSASVTRAVTMFSIVTIALNLKRPTNIYNTLAVSIFIILLFKPLFLFDVGFQLSYLAVFAIVLIDPYLYNLWKPKFWLTDKVWHTLTITISAQFGIIPLSLYYFHQFPSLFLISNLVIVPFLGILLGFGFFVIVLASLNILPLFMANIYEYSIRLMNGFIRWISYQEQFLFKNISFNIFLTISSYLVIIFFIKLFFKKNYFNLKSFLIVIILFQSVLFLNKYNNPKNEFIVFHKSRFSLLGHTHGNTIMVSSNFDSLTKSNNTIVTNYNIGKHINSIEECKLQSVYQLNNKTLFVIDSFGVYNIKSFKPDYILLRQSPKINLNRVIDSLKPKQVIADGSNYKSYTQYWKSICKKRKLPFHLTSEKGAYIIKY